MLPTWQLQRNHVVDNLESLKHNNNNNHYETNHTLYTVY